MAVSKDFKEIVERLALPFTQSSIEFVVTFTSGDTLEDVKIGVAPYVKRESILTRLDVVCGPAGWSNELIVSRPDALFNGITIFNIDQSSGHVQPVTKWDGAAVEVTNRAGNDRLDPIKTVSTNSFKRAAEVWGIGRYLKDIPPMFGVKQPADNWDSDEWTKKGKGKDTFFIRWNHPQIPAEFLPEFMTPEQYVALKGLRKHFSAEVSKPINDYIKSYEEDWRSVPYSEVATKIYDIRAYIKKKLGHINPKEIQRTDSRPAPGKKSPPKKQPDNKPEEPDYYNVIVKLQSKMDYAFQNKDVITSANDKEIIATKNYIDGIVAKTKKIPTGEKVDSMIQIIDGWKKEVESQLPFK